MWTLVFMAAMAAISYYTRPDPPDPVTPPAIPPPAATPGLDIEQQKKKRPKHGVGATILTGDLEPAEVKRTKLGAPVGVLG